MVPRGKTIRQIQNAGHSATQIGASFQQAGAQLKKKKVGEVEWLGVVLG